MHIKFSPKRKVEKNINAKYKKHKKHKNTKKEKKKRRGLPHAIVEIIRFGLKTLQTGFEYFNNRNLESEHLQITI